MPTRGSAADVRVNVLLSAVAQAAVSWASKPPSPMARPCSRAGRSRGSGNSVAKAGSACSEINSASAHRRLMPTVHTVLHTACSYRALGARCRRLLVGGPSDWHSHLVQGQPAQHSAPHAVECLAALAGAPAGHVGSRPPPAHVTFQDVLHSAVDMWSCAHMYQTPA